MTNNVGPEGTIAYVIKGAHDDWITNSNGYRFPDKTDGGISVRATKHPDKTITIEISGPFGGTYEFTEACPATSADSLHICITWKNNTVSLHLNGTRVRTLDSPRTTQ